MDVTRQRAPLALDPAKNLSDFLPSQQVGQTMWGRTETRHFGSVSVGASALTADLILCYRFVVSTFRDGLEEQDFN
jgi:hypothetical protein